jgi:hypothetical protein
MSWAYRDIFYGVIYECILEASMNQLTLRKIPGPVERKLRLYSKQNNESLNKSVISILSKALGVSDSPHPKRKRNLSRFMGAMSSDEAKKFNNDTSDFEKIDKELWK